MNPTSLSEIYLFYQNQPSQIKNIDLIEKWFSSNNKNKTLLVTGNIGIGKSTIINCFLKQSNYDILDIAELFEIYENINNYTYKDFIPKILKQKNVNKMTYLDSSLQTNIEQSKLLLIDSLEEHFITQKTVIREIIENLDKLAMPVVIVMDKNYLEQLEKKVYTKIKKLCEIIELEVPTVESLKNYIKNIIKGEFKESTIEQIISYSQGDIRNLNNMIGFSRIGNSSIDIQNSFQGNEKDIEVEVEGFLKKIHRTCFSESLDKCEIDPFIFGMLTYENYIYQKNKNINTSKDIIIDSICKADNLEKVIFKHQAWELLDLYSFYSTVFPWKMLEPPKNILPSTTLQKFMNTKKKNKKYDLPF